MRGQGNRNMALGVCKICLWIPLKLPESARYDGASSSKCSRGENTYHTMNGYGCCWFGTFEELIIFIIWKWRGYQYTHSAISDRVQGGSQQFLRHFIVLRPGTEILYAFFWAPIYYGISWDSIIDILIGKYSQSLALLHVGAPHTKKWGLKFCKSNNCPEMREHSPFDPVTVVDWRSTAPEG